MNQIANFEKVSFKQYLNDFKKLFPEIDISSQNVLDQIKNEYSNIKLPKRATAQSAGYDFYSPINFDLYRSDHEYELRGKKDVEITIPTGIRCRMDGDYVLLCFPRSSLGFKYKLMFANTIPVIDADYYFAKNEGHIMLKLVNRENNLITINAGDRFAQGIFIPYGITVDDDATAVRTGGFGSTN